jgi:hypothetical protein
MCLIIDTCCLAKVFDRTNHQHGDFAPVLEWITEGTGRIIYGGSKYKTELEKATRFLGIIAELKQKGRAIQVPQQSADAIAEKLRNQINDSNFDDEHLVALVIVSRCRVVCTNDNAAISYLKLPTCYSDYAVKRPKIYRSKRNGNLCRDKYVAEICRR